MADARTELPASVYEYCARQAVSVMRILVDEVGQFVTLLRQDKRTESGSDGHQGIGLNERHHDGLEVVSGMSATEADGCFFDMLRITLCLPDDQQCRALLSRSGSTLHPGLEFLRHEHVRNSIETILTKHRSEIITHIATSQLDGEARINNPRILDIAWECIEVCRQARDILPLAP